jgi:Heterokaryon incompatibility protein (HET)
MVPDPASDRQDHLCKALEDALTKLWRRSADGKHVVPIYTPSPNTRTVLQPAVPLKTHRLVLAPACVACEQYQHLLPCDLQSGTIFMQHYRMDFLLDIPKTLPTTDTNSDAETLDYSFYTSLNMAIDETKTRHAQRNIAPLGQPGFLSPKLIDPNSVDFASVNDWLSNCSVQHESLCLVKHKPEVRSMSLIDTHNNTVVLYSNIQNLESQVEYLCLSYVWGSIEQNIVRDGDLLLRIPQTIEDAMRFTRRIGKRYLWADSVGGSAIRKDSSLTQNRFASIKKILCTKQVSSPLCT